MKKQNTIILVGAVAVIAAFAGGMLYGKSSATITPQMFQSMSPEQQQQLFSSLRGSGTRTGSQRVQNGGGFISGDVIAKDAQSITVKTRDGSSHIVFYTGTTEITKPSPASINDVSEGVSVTITGTTNSDGSITAQSVQVREPQQPIQPK